MVRWANATNVYVELDSEDLTGPGEGFDLNARNATLKVDARVVVRLAADAEHPGVSRASFAALFVEFPKPAGDPVEADRKVAAEVLAYLLRDGVPPPASDALKPLDGTGWIPSGRAEQDAFVERASKAVVRAYTRWVLEAEAGKPPNPDDLSPDRDLLARADPELAALPTEALVGGLVARLTAGRDARRKIVARVLAERAVTVEEIGRILLDPTLTLRTLREMQNQHELSSDMPWPDEPDPEAVAAGHFSVWLVRAELPGIYQRVASLKHPGGLNPGSPTPWASVELLIKAFRDLVETTVTERDFPPSRHHEPDVGKYGLLAMLDDWLTTKPTLGAPPIAHNPPTVSPANPPVAVELATERPPPAPPPLPLGIPVPPSEAGLRLTVGGESLRASGITALYR